MPEYEAPKVNWNKPLTVSTGTSGYGMSDDSYLDKISLFPNVRDFPSSTDVQNMEHILFNMRSARQNGTDHINMRAIFLNFPSRGASVDLAGITDILGSRIPMHINMAVYDNMNIGLYSNMGIYQNHFNGVNVNGLIKSGNWNNLRLSRYGGNIPMMSIHFQHSNADLLYNYIYR